jgi:glutathione synthase/RimK-type ligase-like ATP-grasp enzyme
VKFSAFPQEQESMTLGSTAPAAYPPTVSTGEFATIGLAALASMAFAGADLQPVQRHLIERLAADPQDAAALMDLATLTQLAGDRASGLALQQQALRLQPLYRRPAPAGEAPGPRLLAFMADGDFMANTPVDFLLEGSGIALNMLYLAPGAASPTAIPDHDIALVAVGESDDNRGVLEGLKSVVQAWPTPVLNDPARIALLSRDSAYELLRSAPGLVVPPTIRIARDALAATPSAVAGLAYPIIARPIASHAGQGLVKLDGAAAALHYLDELPDAEFYVAPFIDYSGADGFFRKYRIAFVAGRPYPVHLAVSEHWIVHYLSAGMDESAERRAEEARFMSDFDIDFAGRHATALKALAERVGLDYFAIDCGETKDGALLLFEADVAMIVHAMDPPEKYAYKLPAMRKLFAAFADLLRSAAAAGARSAAGGAA